MPSDLFKQPLNTPLRTTLCSTRDILKQSMPGDKSAVWCSHTGRPQTGVPNCRFSSHSFASKPTDLGEGTNDSSALEYEDKTLFEDCEHLNLGDKQQPGDPVDLIITNEEIDPEVSSLLAHLSSARRELKVSPYSILIRTYAAVIFFKVGYPDLAAGEAYKAVLLADEYLNEGDLKENVQAAARKDILQLIRLQQKENGNGKTVEDADDNGETACEHTHIQAAEDHDEAAQNSSGQEERFLHDFDLLHASAYIQLISSLFACGCLKSAYIYCQRAKKMFHHVLDQSDLHVLHGEIVNSLKQSLDNKGLEWTPALPMEYWPDKTLVRREVYGWNIYEPDRYTPESLTILCRRLENVAPKLGVRVVELPALQSDSDICRPQNPLKTKQLGVFTKEVPHTLKQLGLFAKEDLLPNEVILDEASFLIARADLDDPFCDACGCDLTKLADESRVACHDCDFQFCACCHEHALEKYHTAICGTEAEALTTSWAWKDKLDGLYARLLLRVLAMAATQDTHPLRVDEIEFIWGDYTADTLPDGEKWKVANTDNTDAFSNFRRTLPFSFEANIATPFQMLDRMGIDVFKNEERFDVWVFNTIYAKLRGTASARQNRETGETEIAAVHPVWCLANHSCDPNVKWAWEGTMQFVVRPKLGRVGWSRGSVKKWPSELHEDKLLAGEEILSHYCDIDLPVSERREWAAGALGGLCRCARCLWETKVDSNH